MTVTKQKMAAALARLPGGLDAKTLNMEFYPWFVQKNKFVYKLERFDGRGRKAADLMLFDAKEGGQTLLAEGRKLEKSLSKALDRPVDLVTEPITVLGLEEGGFRFRLADGAVYALRHNRLSKQRSALTPGAVLSPDGNKVLYGKSGELYMRDLNGGRTHRLTKDGKPQDGYGLADLAGGVTEAPCGVLWSPDNVHFLTYRTDYTGMDRQHLSGAGQTLSWPADLPGSSKPVLSRWYLGNADTGVLTALDTDPFYGIPLGSRTYAAWSEEGGMAAVCAITADGTTVKVYTVSAGTGKTQELFVEHSDRGLTFDSDREFFNNGMTGRCAWLGLMSEKLGHLYWISDRSGNAHVWRYDLRNGSSKQMTSGDFQVTQLIDLDTKGRTLYLTACGREGNTLPDHKYLYSLELQKGKLELLSRTKGDNRIFMSPDRDWFLACVSSYDTPQETALHNMDGEIRFPVCSGDIEKLEDLHFVYPIPRHEPGADGKTEIKAMLFMPANFDGDKEYPIIDLYEGDTGRCAVPVRFSDILRQPCQALSALGFASIMIDGRGTPGRGKKFREQGYGNLAACAGLSDHVAVLISLLQQFPFLDDGKVGVLGQGPGAFGALHGLCAAPELYKAAVGVSGCYDFDLCRRELSVRRMGAYDAQAWADQLPDLSGLKGDLLLAWGTMDKTVHPDNTASLMAALQEADKNYDALPLVGAGHDLWAEEYFCRRVLDYLCKTLG